MKRIFLVAISLVVSCLSYGQAYTLYGMTSAGGTGNSGVIFSYNIKTNKDSVIHNFIGHPTDGITPYGSLMYDSVNALLYAEAYAGGTDYFGTLFYINPKTGKDSSVISFNGTNGENPTYTTPLLASDRMIYGVTESGGDSGWGVIFKYNPVTFKDTIVFNFNGTSESGSPDGALIQATDGLLYGLADWGGDSNNGVLYSFDPVTNTEKVLLKFNGTDGSNPEGSLMQASNGILYGGTSFGGLYAGGTLFSYNPVTKKDTIYLSLGGATGKFFYGNLIQAYDGLLYGMAEEDGANGDGVIFSLDPTSGAFNVVFNFNGTNGKFPWGSLIQNPGDSLLYGMTYYGGVNNDGVLFSFNTITDNETVLVNFNGSVNGANPFGSLTLVKTSLPETVKNILNLSTINLYPSPNDGRFTITMNGVNEKTEIEIYNTLGEKIYTVKLNTNATQIDLGNKSSGVYLFRVLTERAELIAQGKFIIQ
jgi:uncharacterized repeat protein (TIGR03803 family)